MAAFGEHLRAARIAKGVSLEQISGPTRITVRMLEAIENEQFERLPGGVFDVSFIRQYACAVGLDEEQTVAEFKELTGTRRAELEDPFGPESDQDQDKVHTVAAQAAERLTEWLRQYRALAPSVAAAFVVVGATLALVLGWSESDPAAPELLASPAEARLTRTATLDPSSADGRAGSADMAAEAPVRVELTMREEVWVKALSDGRRVFEDNLQPGDQRFISAFQSVWLMLGNAGGVSITLNGRTLPDVGPRGSVRRVVITPAGLEVIKPPPKKRSRDQASRVETASAGAAPAQVVAQVNR